MEGVTFRGRRVNMKLHEYKFSGSRANAKSVKDRRKALRPRRKT